MGPEGHLDHHGGKRLRHERENVRVVVAQVVTPQEGVVDAAPVEGPEVALIVAGGTAEQVDFGLGLAAVLPGQQAAGRDPDLVEADRVGADG
jgi:hypothetical protein